MSCSLSFHHQMPDILDTITNNPMDVGEISGAASEDIIVGRNNWCNWVWCRVFVLSMLFKVHWRDESLWTLDALIASFHQVNLWLGVSVQIRLGHALVVTQPAHVLTDSYITIASVTVTVSITLSNSINFLQTVKLSQDTRTLLWSDSIYSLGSTASTFHNQWIK